MLSIPMNRLFHFWINSSGDRADINQWDDWTALLALVSTDANILMLVLNTWLGLTVCRCSHGAPTLSISYARNPMSGASASILTDFAASRSALGHHSFDGRISLLSYSTQMSFYQKTYAFEVLYSLAISFVKFSV